jgi:sulfur transfer protein SufE
MPRACRAEGRRARAAPPAAAGATTAHPRRPPALALLSSGLASARRATTSGATTTSSPSCSRPAHRQHQQPSPRSIAHRRPAALAAAPSSADGAGASSSSSAPAPLPAPLQRIVAAFQAVPDPMARYKQLLFYAAKLPGLPEELRVPQNKVEGCVSQVWVVPELRGDGKVYWRADSDSQLTKGLAALLVTGLSGCSPQEVLSVTPAFVEALGLKQSLTPSRNNGFLNMLRKMQRATLELAAASAAASSASAAS